MSNCALHADIQNCTLTFKTAHPHPKTARSAAKLRVHTPKPKLRTHIRKSTHSRNLALTSENCALTLKTPRPHSKLRPHIRNNAPTSKWRAHIEPARSHPKVAFLSETVRSHPNLTKQRAHIRNCALAIEITYTQNYALTSETARAERSNTPHRTVPCSSQPAVQYCVRAALNRAAL